MIIVATIASSRPPERQPLERRTLVPIDFIHTRNFFIETEYEELIKKKASTSFGSLERENSTLSTKPVVETATAGVGDNKSEL